MSSCRAVDMKFSARVRRFDTLFSRLLVLQALTATALVLLFGALFYVERNITVARLVAERWAPSLHAAATGQAADSVTPALPVLRRDTLPSLSVHPRHWAPRAQVLVDSLRAGGVAVEDLAYSRTDGNPLVWVGVRGPATMRAGGCTPSRGKSVFSRASSASVAGAWAAGCGAVACGFAGTATSTTRLSGAGAAAAAVVAGARFAPGGAAAVLNSVGIHRIVQTVRTSATSGPRAEREEGRRRVFWLTPAA